ncbi:alpha/beta fold hydrolase [Sphingomonas sp. UYP23]
MGAEIEYREAGTGPGVVLVPGSCSTGAAWRPVVAHLHGVRAITTSLPGYGGTAERRTDADLSIAPAAEVIEELIAQVGGAVHLVGHSFGGSVALAVALRGTSPLLSLTVFEAPAPGALIGVAERAHLDAFTIMTDAYSAAYRAGEVDAIGQMIDFYGGLGSWDAMPEPVRAYAVATTSVNLMDWQNAYRFVLDDGLAALAGLPVCVAVGSRSHPAAIRANRLVAERIPGAVFETITGASHFMTATHPEAVAKLIKRQIAVQSA